MRKRERKKAEKDTISYVNKSERWSVADCTWETLPMTKCKRRRKKILTEQKWWNENQNETRMKENSSLFGLLWCHLLFNINKMEYEENGYFLCENTPSVWQRWKCFSTNFSLRLYKRTRSPWSEEKCENKFAVEEVFQNF